MVLAGVAQGNIWLLRDANRCSRNTARNGVTTVEFVTVTEAEVSRLAATNRRNRVVGEGFTARFLVAFFGNGCG